jgi:hypothetical protein
MNQNELRGDGKLPVISIDAKTIAEGTYKAIVGCYDQGARIETPKQREDMSLGYDADMIVRIENPLEGPHACYPGIHDDARGIVQYMLEVTHGIHNHWKKSEEHPNRWGYTYNERFVDQLPFVFQRIKSDFEEKGRITGRDYQFGIWRAGEDIILEQDDPPCFQRGHMRFLINDEGEHVLNYITDWRSRCLLKAWNENNLGQSGPHGLQKLFADKVSNMLEIPINVGAYIDRSSSLHLYGLYVDRDNLDKQIEIMKEKGFEKLSCSVDGLIENTNLSMKCKGFDGLKRLVAAQGDAEAKGLGTNLSEVLLERQGYNLDSFEYPDEWDTWPSSWDAEPDVNKLARVLGNEDILVKASEVLGMSYTGFKRMFGNHLKESGMVMKD